jgi:LuxR family maltose regulon positive regulatory protein
LRVQLGLVRAARESHHLTFALEWARACGIVLDECDDDAFFHQRPRTLVRVRIAQHRMRGGVDLQPVLRFLDRYLCHAEKWRVPIRAIEALCLRAMALQVRGDTSQAVAAVQRALVLGEPEGYVYSFVREGAPLAALLPLAAPGHVSPAYLSKLLEAFSVSGCGDVVLPDPHTSALPEPLTPREMEVLRLVAVGASNPEIARQLFVTLNTVKRHVTHILGKLGVSNRTQAATRARDLNLLE